MVGGYWPEKLQIRTFLRSESHENLITYVVCQLRKYMNACYLIYMLSSNNQWDSVTNKATKLLSAVTVCWYCFHNGVMTHMPQISESTMHRTFVAWIVFMEVIFPGLNLQPADDRLLPYHFMSGVLLKLFLSSQASLIALKLGCIVLTTMI